MKGSDRIATAFLAACDDELQALKPGNVHVHAPGHGMTVSDFRRSAAAAVKSLCRSGLSLGVRVLGAVTATREAVGQNTNLGILLLCAPLAMAAERCDTPLPDAVRAVLDGADLADADAVFQAIVLAAPGGLGEAAQHDVRQKATVVLRTAMAEAAERDSIARQYVTGFADVFGLGTEAYAAALARWRAPTLAATTCYVRFLAEFPDSHLVRKCGGVVALRVQHDAIELSKRLSDSSDPTTLMADLLAWDAELKRAGLNPGTSADLTVATIFAWRLRQALQSRQRDGSVLPC